MQSEYKIEKIKKPKLEELRSYFSKIGWKVIDTYQVTDDKTGKSFVLFKVNYFYQFETVSKTGGRINTSNDFFYLGYISDILHEGFSHIRPKNTWDRVRLIFQKSKMKSNNPKFDNIFEVDSTNKDFFQLNESEELLRICVKHAHFEYILSNKNLFFKSNRLLSQNNKLNYIQIGFDLSSISIPNNLF